MYIQQLIAKYFKNSYKFMYYQYLDKFHSMPNDFIDLSDFCDYMAVNNGIEAYYKTIGSQ